VGWLLGPWNNLEKSQMYWGLGMIKKKWWDVCGLEIIKRKRVICLGPRNKQEKRVGYLWPWNN